VFLSFVTFDSVFSELANRLAQSIASSHLSRCMTITAGADRPMQLNQGWFLCNGHCGYVLQPDYLKQTSYSPFDKHTLVNVDPVTISVTVSQLTAR